MEVNDWNDDIEEALEDFIGLNWKTFRVSAICLIDPDRLPTVAQKLKLVINNKKSTCFVSNVKVTLVPKLKIAENAPAAIKITVIKEKCVYTGFLINFENEYQMSQHYERRPLLLVNGSVGITGLIHSALVKVLDCVVTPMELNARVLVQIFALLVMLSPSNEKGMAHLKFNIPGLPRQDAITIGAGIKTSSIIFNHLNDLNNETPGGPMPDIDQLFYNKMLAHFTSVYCLDLHNADLVEVILPNGTASCEGKITFKDVDAAHRVLMAVSNHLLTSYPMPCSSRANSITMTDRS